MKATKKYKKGGKVKRRRPLSKKKAIRNMRTFSRENEDGSESTHLMEWVGDPNKKRGEFGVFPSIAPKEGNTGSSDPKDWEEIGPEEAEKRGEMVRVKSKRKAEKLAMGSWKKGRDKRDAMKGYREWKREMRRSKKG